MTKIEQLLSLIDAIVHDSRPWLEKKDAILAAASEDDKANLEEFVAWFEEPKE